MKQIQIKTKSTVQIHANDFLEAINDLRQKYGETEELKQPIDLDEALSSIRLFENRDAEHGMLTLQLHYEDADKTSCTRDFPNFGLEVKSSSRLEAKNQNLFLDVDITIKAGKKKWQTDEVAECAAIFKRKKFCVSLNVTLDQTAEWAGHSAIVTTVQDAPNAFGIDAIAASHFISEIK
jgi:hypothetical protein